MFFSASGLETEGQIKEKQKMKFAVTCSFQKVIQTLTFRRRKKFDSSLNIVNFLL